MTTTLWRSFGLRAVIVVVLCVLAWRGVVGPQRAAVAEMRVQLEERRAEIVSGERRLRDAGEVSEGAIVALRQRADAIDAMWAGSRDAVGLYDRLTAIAARTGVAIERLDPVERDSRQARTRGFDGIEAESFGYSVQAVGGFREVASFVDAIEREAGLARIETFRIAPVPGDPNGLVGVQVRTVHHGVKGSIRTVSAAQLEANR